MADHHINFEFDMRRALDEAERMEAAGIPISKGYLAELVDVTANGKPVDFDPEALEALFDLDDDISPYGELP